jgi:hypothetical protein
MDNLLPCPNPLCTKSLPFAEAFKISCHSCGTSGAIHVDRDKAIAAWNSLPRATLWVEYDGTDATLPPKDKKVLVDSIYVMVKIGINSMALHGIAWKDHVHGKWWSVTVGDRWIPWPGGGE